MNRAFSELPDFVAIQLNDTHPAIAIPELMRLLMDEEGLVWDDAWPICEKTFAYTNHTVLPEALETWPVDLIGRILPRHMEIIFEINQPFPDHGQHRGKAGDSSLAQRVSLIVEGGQQRVRMAHLAIVGSHTVNGVAKLHSKIIKEELFKDFDSPFRPSCQCHQRHHPRRWLAQANPPLAKLINDTIGPEWITNLDRLRKLEPLAEDAAFRQRWIKPSATTKCGWHAISCEKSAWGSIRTPFLTFRSSASMSTSASCSTSSM